MEEAVETEESSEGSGLSPGFIILVALLSIGGLLFLGWQSIVVGEYTYTITPYAENPYTSCCTVQPWGSSASGYRQGTGVTNTELCGPDELPNRCCVRAGRERFDSPVNLVASSVGSCAAPEVSYPFSAVGYQACCTTESYQRSSTGYTQGTAETQTHDCDNIESLVQCCARGSASRLNLPVRVLGVRAGGCEMPERSYPVGQFNIRGFSACCSFETWQQSSTGYTQGNVQTINGNCDELQTVGQCCLRAASLSTGLPVKLLGSKIGSCLSTVPEANYPVWIR